MKLALVVPRSPDAAPDVAALASFSRGPIIWVAGWNMAADEVSAFSHPSDPVLRDVTACIVAGRSTGYASFLPYLPCVIELIQDLDERRCFIAGVGEGVGVLAQAGLLLGREAVWRGEPTFCETLTQYGARVIDADHAQSGRIHTGWGDVGLMRIADALDARGDNMI